MIIIIINHGNYKKKNRYDWLVEKTTVRLGWIDIKVVKNVYIVAIIIIYI